MIALLVLGDGRKWKLGCGRMWVLALLALGVWLKVVTPMLHKICWRTPK
jgi:hypothetical protein